MPDQSLVLFYSWSGHTRRVANTIAAQLGADLCELRPREPYPSDYALTAARGEREWKEKAYPPLRELSIQWERYGTVYLGTPNWFSTMAPAVVSFLWEVMPTEKTVVPFCTHGGGGGGRIARDIADYCLGCDVLPMLTIQGDGGGAVERVVAEWLDKTRQIMRLKRESVDRVPLF